MPLYLKVVLPIAGLILGIFSLTVPEGARSQSPIIMLRSIAEIARSEGEDPSDPEAALSCIQVFALGGRPGSTDASESGYFAVKPHDLSRSVVLSRKGPRLSSALSRRWPRGLEWC